MDAARYWECNGCGDYYQVGKTHEPISVVITKGEFTEERGEYCKTCAKSIKLPKNTDVPEGWAPSIHKGK